MRSFLISFFVTVSFGFIAVGPVFFYLWEIGEYLSAKEIIERQAGSKEVIFGTGLRREEGYKLEALATRRPAIVSLGSSRVMQFRQHSFKYEFFNLGGLMNSIHAGHEVASEIIEAGPKIIILGIDIWWFNETYLKPIVYNNTVSKPYQAIPKLSDVYQFMTYVYRGSINFDLSNDHIGLSGKRGDGFGNDGFRHYGTLLTGPSNQEAKFKDTFSRIDSGSLRFEYGLVANQEHLEHFKKLIDRFEDRDIDVIVFFPPFASAVNSKMDSLGERYSYVRVLKTKLKQMDIEYLDYTRADLIGSNDCEFIDGFHGGEITFLRILRDMSIKTSFIGTIVDTGAIDKLINTNTGMVTSTTNFPTGDREIDFLQLGCSKSRVGLSDYPMSRGG